MMNLIELDEMLRRVGRLNARACIIAVEYGGEVHPATESRPCQVELDGSSSPVATRNPGPGLSGSLNRGWGQPGTRR